ncbi:MAG: hypothetical protein ACO32I_07170 [Candidatus Limnocylindrus sp.]
MLDLDPIKARLGAVDGMQPAAYREFLHHAAQDVEALMAEVERLRAAICKHRDGWHQSENNMLVDRVVKRAAQARELWAVLDA